MSDTRDTIHAGLTAILVWLALYFELHGGLLSGEQDFRYMELIATQRVWAVFFSGSRQLRYRRLDLSSRRHPSRERARRRNGARHLRRLPHPRRRQRLVRHLRHHRRDGLSSSFSPREGRTLEPVVLGCSKHDRSSDRSLVGRYCRFGPECRERHMGVLALVDRARRSPA